VLVLEGAKGAEGAAHYSRHPRPHLAPAPLPPLAPAPSAP